ncbi:GMC oxidoreductase [Pseudofrankia inefficax]|uniref:Cholesterol oxidase n=1 Tax=Pseudofrankia inefficax (strain DSM 45817 / CECT 9037 / DDB 130130 / EuI1c) TaxID=298654 RepID=E3J6Y5_PSEI1|nr:GMC oxidoreductase [Pseudofrankia inefficax]ADP83205.1 GMC oxidoreductase [Pseudofrankia inefficax]
MVRKSAPEQVETVVVGSGFGGSVTAFRLAEAGRDVLVLERGRAYPPGSFPRSPAELAGAFWDPDAGRHGLFDVWSLGGSDAVVSAGLGGGSLIFANALERAEERWFARADPPGAGAARGGAGSRGSGAGRGSTRRRATAGQPWPVGRADLEPHYDAVERMLGATPFPAGRPGYENAGRPAAVRAAARRAGLDWRAPALAVSFGVRGTTAPGLALPEAAYGNVHGRARTTCQLAGDCVLGCNHGAKNSLDHTYLSAAAYHGAEIRTRCEVRGIAPDGEGGWVVSYVEHHRAVDGTPVDTVALPMRAVRCSRVVLAAGALGSTYLLLRARPGLPAVSPLLGHEFSGNGDVLGLVVGARHGDRPAWPAGGAPTITGAVQLPAALQGSGPGFVLHDAGVPAFLSWLLAAREVALHGSGGHGVPGLPAGLGLPGVGRSLRLARDAREWVAARLFGGAGGDLRGRLARLADAGAAAEPLLALLAVGRAGTDGVLRLDGDRLAVERSGAGHDEYLERVRATMAELAAELGGRFEAGPGTAHQRTTAHPLGGASMGTSARDGVVDEFGQVFGHPGLYVVDGAVFPGPVGAAPALTIAAFADRAAQRMVADGRRRARTVPRPRTSPGTRALAVPSGTTRTRTARSTTSARAGASAAGGGSVHGGGSVSRAATSAGGRTSAPRTSSGTKGSTAMKASTTAPTGSRAAGTRTATTQARQSTGTGGTRATGGTAAAKPAGRATAAKAAGRATPAKALGPAKPAGQAVTTTSAGRATTAKIAEPARTAKPAGQAMSKTSAGRSTTAKVAGRASTAKAAGQASTAKAAGRVSTAKAGGAGTRASSGGRGVASRPAGERPAGKGPVDASGLRSGAATAVDVPLQAAGPAGSAVRGAVPGAATGGAGARRAAVAR